MKPSKQPTFKPLVVGAPRTGFTLLISVLVKLYPLMQNKEDLQRRVMRAFIDTAGWDVSSAIVDAFAAQGINSDLLYNRSFRELVGGPKWLHADDPERACLRKYLGVRGVGDFTLITSHPRAVLDYHDIVHSHSHPQLWSRHPGYAGYQKFASIRNPVGTLNSSCFSLNALTSEYIQRFVPPEQDNDYLRQHLALYKLTDLDFFTGLITSLKDYWLDYLECRSEYKEMRWEDLINRPRETILEVAAQAGAAIDAVQADAIWHNIGHTNLTGTHKHNFRPGGGRVGGWRETLTNDHLSLMREAGLSTICEQLGYKAIADLDTDAYTPIQRQVSKYIARGEVFRDYPDSDLFEFAFNKSNLDFTRFPRFHSYEWRDATRIERSSMDDETLVKKIWDVAEVVTSRFNQAFELLMQGDFGTPASALSRIREVTADGTAMRNPKACRQAMESVVLTPPKWRRLMNRLVRYSTGLLGHEG